ncbi:hypothetical protein WA026_018344, partial [Henosepilachna vigintioctopunctata]
KVIKKLFLNTGLLSSQLPIVEIIVKPVDIHKCLYLTWPEKIVGINSKRREKGAINGNSEFHRGWRQITLKYRVVGVVPVFIEWKTHMCGFFGKAMATSPRIPSLEKGDSSLVNILFPEVIGCCLRRKIYNIYCNYSSAAAFWLNRFLYRDSRSGGVYRRKYLRYIWVVLFVI